MRYALAAALMLVLAVPAAAGDDEGRIRVIGRASSGRAPDFASVEVGVESRGATPAAALDAASRTAKGVIESAREMGVPEADIGTTSITLQPRTKTVNQPDGTVREVSDGYGAGNLVRLRLAEMGKLGELLRRALDSGANRIEGIAFGLRDPAAAEAAMQSAAMKDARAQAERLAEAAGVRLGPTLSITALAQHDAPQLQAFRSSAGSAFGARKSVPIEAGSIETSAKVEAVFAIAR